MLACKIGLITYHHPHLKTEQVMNSLLLRGYDLEVFALPFIPRASRGVRFEHRPRQSFAVMAADISVHFGVPYHLCGSDSDIGAHCDLYLVLGAGILSPACVRGKKILNCHPGVIPSSRGLDSFKWALYEMKPLGVTLHYIDENVDAGEIVAVVPTPVYSSDTLETLARRHYENEIRILSDFEYFMANPFNAFPDAQIGRARKRMPLSKEGELSALISGYIAKYGGALLGRRAPG